MAKEASSELGKIISLPTGAVRFGPYRFDPTNVTLSRGDGQIHLPPRALSVLEYLVRRPGLLVSKDSLLEALWGDIHVTEDSLTQAISLIRQALGDDPRSPTYIETVPRLGYRFIADVSAAARVRAGEPVAVGPHAAAEAPSGPPRPVAPETELGRYTILTLIGAGAMGEVWRAKDTDLNREVAIKVVPPELAEEAKVMRRFRREARLLARLNHPNIATIHGVEERDGTRFIVMELLEGETLDRRLEDGPLPIEEALEISRQVAEALEAAHEKGIIHRDLKPANVVLAHGRRVKVLDFGLAKELRPEDSGETSEQTTATRSGVMLGTAPYMSPEQVRGQAVDKRTDIWAFGCLLYELLTGQRAFHRDTVADTLAAILEKEPDWKYLPDATPRAARRLLARCLDKRLTHRLRDIGDARIEIESAQEREEAKRRGRTRRLKWWPAAVAASAVAVGVAIGVGGFSNRSIEPTIMKSYRPVVTWPTAENNGRISPDGQIVAFTLETGGNRQLWLRSVDGTAPQSITDPLENLKDPVWSPDSRQIAYLSQEAGATQIQIISVWGEAQGRPISIAAEYGGANLVRWLGTRIYLTIAEPAATAASRLWRYDLGNESLELVQDPRSDVRILALDYVVNVDVSADEQRMVFVAQADGNEDLWTSDLLGLEPMRLTDSEARVFTPRWKNSEADAVLYVTDEGGQYDVWQYSLASGDAKPITTGPLEEGAISVSADGGLIATDTARAASHLWMIPAGGAPRQMTNEARLDLWPGVSTTGDTLLFHRSDPGLNLFESSIHVGPWHLPLEEERMPALAEGFGACLSPSGSWFTFLRRTRGSSARGAELWLQPTEQRGVQRLLAARSSIPSLSFQTWSWRWATVAWDLEDDEVFYVSVNDSELDELNRTPVAEPGVPSVIATAESVESRLGDLRVSPDGVRIAYVTGFSDSMRGGSIVVNDLGGDPSRTILTRQEGHQVFLKGWVGERLLVLVTRLRSGASPLTDVLLVDLSGGTETIRSLEGVSPANAELISATGDLYMTRVEGDYAHVDRLSLHDRELFHLIESEVPGISFAGYGIVDGENLIYTRKEDIHDVWLIDLRR